MDEPAGCQARYESATCDFSVFLCQVVMKQNAVIEHLKQKKIMTPVEREENQRFEFVLSCLVVFLCLSIFFFFYKSVTLRLLSAFQDDRV